MVVCVHTFGAQSSAITSLSVLVTYLSNEVHLVQYETAW